jgi:hypothetical protein
MKCFEFLQKECGRTLHKLYFMATVSGLATAAVLAFITRAAANV